ncbi:SRPBCC family protein [Agromyces bauzanensis]
MGWLRGMATGVAVVGAFVGAFALVRRASLRWGASDDELRMALPGDDLLPAPDLVATRAISIAAPPADVWPWIAQLGQNRGGFSTYDWLENLVGVDIRTADRIVPDLRVQGVGDTVNLAPEVALEVVALETERHLVLRGAVAVDGTGAGAPYDFTWAFVLLRRFDGSTRLVVRERYAYLTGWAAALVEPVEMVSFLMTERMLRGIRDRAERTARPAARDRSTGSPSAG